MKLYETRCAVAAWILGTTTRSIQDAIGHFDSRKKPGSIPMLCPRCSRPIPLGEEAWVAEGPGQMATCVGCADA